MWNQYQAGTGIVLDNKSKVAGNLALMQQASPMQHKSSASLVERQLSGESVLFKENSAEKENFRFPALQSCLSPRQQQGAGFTDFPTGADGEASLSPRPSMLTPPGRKLTLNVPKYDALIPDGMCTPEGALTPNGTSRRARLDDLKGKFDSLVQQQNSLRKSQNLRRSRDNYSLQRYMNSPEMANRNMSPLRSPLHSPEPSRPPVGFNDVSNKLFASPAPLFKQSPLLASVPPSSDQTMLSGASAKLSLPNKPRATPQASPALGTSLFYSHSEATVLQVSTTPKASQQTGNTQSNPLFTLANNVSSPMPEPKQNPATNTTPGVIGSPVTFNPVTEQASDTPDMKPRVTPGTLNLDPHVLTPEKVAAEQGITARLTQDTTTKLAQASMRRSVSGKVGSGVSTTASQIQAKSPTARASTKTTPASRPNLAGNATGLSPNMSPLRTRPLNRSLSGSLRNIAAAPEATTPESRPARRHWQLGAAVTESTSSSNSNASLLSVGQKRSKPGVFLTSGVSGATRAGGSKGSRDAHVRSPKESTGTAFSPLAVRAAAMRKMGAAASKQAAGGASSAAQLSPKPVAAGTTQSKPAAASFAQLSAKATAASIAPLFAKPAAAKSTHCGTDSTSSVRTKKIVPAPATCPEPQVVTKPSQEAGTAASGRLHSASFAWKQVQSLAEQASGNPVRASLTRGNAARSPKPAGSYNPLRSSRNMGSMTAPAEQQPLSPITTTNPQSAVEHLTTCMRPLRITPKTPASGAAATPTTPTHQRPPTPTQRPTTPTQRPTTPTQRPTTPTTRALQQQQLELEQQFQQQQQQFQQQQLQQQQLQQQREQQQLQQQQLQQQQLQQQREQQQLQQQQLQHQREQQQLHQQQLQLQQQRELLQLQQQQLQLQQQRELLQQYNATEQKQQVNLLSPRQLPLRSLRVASAPAEATRTPTASSAASRTPRTPNSIARPRTPRTLTGVVAAAAAVLKAATATTQAAQATTPPAFATSTPLRNAMRVQAKAAVAATPTTPAGRAGRVLVPAASTPTARRVVPQQEPTEQQLQLEQHVKQNLQEKPTGAKWDDVMGCNQAKTVLQQLLQQLANAKGRDVTPIKGGRKVKPTTTPATAPPPCVLLYGPPGSGKSVMAKTLACEMQAALFLVDGRALMHAIQHGCGPDELLRAVFNAAHKRSSSVVLLDHMEDMFPASKAGLPDSWQRLCTELTVQLDMLKHQRKPWHMCRLMVVATTSAPSRICPTVLQWFKARCYTTLPDADTREEVIFSHMARCDAALSVHDIQTLVRQTEGYTCLDLNDLCHGAAKLAGQSSPTMLHFRDALKDPSAGPSVPLSTVTSIEAWRVASDSI